MSAPRIQITDSMTPKEAVDIEALREKFIAAFDQCHGYLREQMKKVALSDRDADVLHGYLEIFRSPEKFIRDRSSH